MSAREWKEDADVVAERAPETGAPEIAEALRDELVRLSEGKLRAGDIDPSQHMFDCGYIDSLSAVMLIAHVEDRYGVLIEDVELIESLTTLEALAAHVERSR
jgi:acyl carrier protein